jgi:hypothetical protein
MKIHTSNLLACILVTTNKKKQPNADLSTHLGASSFVEFGGILLNAFYGFIIGATVQW